MRGAVAVAAPLAAGILLGLDGATWASITGFNGVLADRGGPYGARAATLAAMTCASAAFAALATLAGGNVALAVPLALAVASCASLARAWGAAGASASMPVLITFLVALSLPVAGPRAPEAIERAGFILTGGGWAMLLTLALWPQPEWNRLPTHLAAALRAAREYLRVVSDALTAEPTAVAEQPMREARRRLALAVINAEESFQRLLGEHRGPPARLEPVMALLAYLRRLGNSVAALALARHAPERRSAEVMAAVDEVAAMAGVALGELAAAISDVRPPAPLSQRPAHGELPRKLPAAPLLGARLDRVVRQVEGIHHAVERWTAASVPASTAASPRQLASFSAISTSRRA